jgi:ArsR family transcriptional regulator, arsenate/arsenite/antimonite-responsive transcriptional repressor
MPATRRRPGIAVAPDRARLFHALSDETRLAILEMLRGGERCVCDLQDDLDAAQSRLSFHLKVLRDAGLVRDRKAGRWSYYALNPERIAEIEAYAGDLARSVGPAGGPALHRIGQPASRPTRAPQDGCC